MKWQSFFGVLALLFSVFLWAAPAYADLPIAQVVWVKGNVSAIAQDNKSRSLKRSDFIYEHETIKTDATGSGQVVFSDSSLLSLRENSEFKIDKYKYSKKSPPSENKFVGNLVKGGLRTVTGAISKDHTENYEMNTPVATIGVRGTQYSIYLTPEGGLEIGIEAGTINVKNDAGAIDLSDKGLPYSKVLSKTEMPKATGTQPAGLTGQPALEPAKPSQQLMTASGVSTTTDSSTTPPAGHGDSGSSSGGSSSGSSSGGGSSGSGAACGIDIH